MKRILFFILLAVCFKISNAQTVTPRSGQASASLQAVTINSINAVLKDGSGNTAITRLNDIYTSVYNSETNINYISDSISSQNALLLSQAQYTTMTFTVTSANTSSAVTAGQTIGNGTYSITIPVGRWQVLGASLTHSLQSATTVIRMYFFQGALNIATQAEGSTYTTASFSALDELISTYATNTTAYVPIVAGSTGAFSHFSVLGVTGSHNDMEILQSGTLKIGVVVGASYTPPLNPQYVVKIRLKRVN